jgi:hypothetical protein
VNQDRRQFYRIEKRVALEFRILENDDDFASQPPSAFKVSPYFMLQTQLREIDIEANKLLKVLTKTAPSVAACLKLMNTKIDIIGQTLAANNRMGEDVKTELVNLSEGGLSFTNSSAIAKDTLMLVKLIFPDACLGLLLHANVQRCEAIEEGFDIGISFLRMPETCRTQLARLIIESQTHEIKTHQHVD